MKPALIAFVLFMPVAVGAGEISERCQQEEMANAAACACIQKVADDTVRPGLHGLLVDHLGKRVDVALIAAERGHSGAEALYDANEAFHREASAQCSVNLRE
ncbi:MAG: hypothetical protein AAF367_10360 [Pseudomonadota bacterium]